MFFHSLSLALLFTIITVTICIKNVLGINTYKPTWDSLDGRPLPKWYDEAKVGIFIHWGVFSVPSYCVGCASEWFWWDWKGVGNPSLVDYMQNNYPVGFQYADFAPQFKAEFFNPSQWADILEASGAEYVVLTSKHHEGFTNWPSTNSWNWNSMDVGPHRDLVGDLADAIRNRTSLRFGLYHSLFEWFHPLYLKDKANGFKTQDFVKTKTMPELYDIVNRYKPEVIWSDGQWEADSSYWNSSHFVAWLYNESPVKETVVVNDRWGSDTLCKHGGFLTCDDRYHPSALQRRKWENAMTLDRESWGFRRNAPVVDYFTVRQLLKEVITTVALGGNILINIGPTSEGTISPIYQERLQQLGTWLATNGEGVYKSQPWTHQNDTLNPDVWYTTRNGAVYAFLLKWPQSGSVVTLGSPIPMSRACTVQLLGHDQLLKWTFTSAGLAVTLPDVGHSGVGVRWAWTLRMTGFDSK